MDGVVCEVGEGYGGMNVNVDIEKGSFVNMGGIMVGVVKVVLG